ncbi:MAG: phenylalanyl-tRNA synthetase alpha chain, partial [Granulosicoccus sp.]
MLQKLEEIKSQIDQAIIKSAEEKETFRLKFLSKKGLIQDLFAAFRDVPNDQKKAFGQQLNALKALAEERFKSSDSGDSGGRNVAQDQDLTRPGFPMELGSRHPVSIVKQDVIAIFKKIGFTLSEGPEIEDDHHNFTALNFPPEHPA